MKKLLTILALSTAAISLGACGKGNSEPTPVIVPNDEVVEKGITEVEKEKLENAIDNTLTKTDYTINISTTIADASYEGTIIVRENVIGINIPNELLDVSSSLPSSLYISKMKDGKIVIITEVDMAIITGSATPTGRNMTIGIDITDELGLNSDSSLTDLAPVILEMLLQQDLTETNFKKKDNVYVYTEIIEDEAYILKMEIDKGAVKNINLEKSGYAINIDFLDEVSNIVVPTPIMIVKLSAVVSMLPGGVDGVLGSILGK